MVDAEAGLHDYMITGGDEHLAQCTAAFVAVQCQLNRIRQLTDSEPEQRAGIAAINKSVTLELSLLQGAADLRRVDPEAAREAVLSGESSRLMNSIRAQISQMKQGEQKVLSERQRQSRSTYATAIKSSVGSAAAGLVMVAAFIYLWRRDLLARARSAALIHEQREWFRTTLASIGDAVIATDCDGKIQFLNRVAQTLTGWSEEESVGRPLGEVFRIINEKSRQAAEDPVSTILQFGKVVGLASHTALLTRNETERSIADSGAPIRDAQGNITGVVLVFRDVTLEKHAGQIDRLLASIVESSDDAIYAKPWMAQY